LGRTHAEFTRQAAQFSRSPATTDPSHVARLVDAIGSAARGRVLDVACGPGIVTSALAAIAREVVALDLTPEMLVKAKERCAAAGRTNVVFTQGSATHLAFATGSFDAVVTRLSFHHFLEPQTVLAEMLRVLKVGGTLAVADVVSAEDAGKAALQNAIEVLRDPSHVRMRSASELVALIAGAGVAVERRESWDKAREFEEWVGIVADPERVAPLRTVVRALAEAGQDAGLALALRDGAIHFVHKWQLVVGTKPRCPCEAGQLAPIARPQRACPFADAGAGRPSRWPAPSRKKQCCRADAHMPQAACKPTSRVPLHRFGAPRESPLQARNLGLGQFADQRVDPGKWLSLSARELPRHRRAGPRRTTKLAKGREHPACQRRYNAPTHGRAEGQKV
jgi:SAM-dependent methyltransferase